MIQRRAFLLTSVAMLALPGASMAREVSKPRPGRGRTVRLAGARAPIEILEDAMGVITRGRSLLYISPGTGYWGIPFRLGASPEVTLVTLRRGARSVARVHRARAA